MNVGDRVRVVNQSEFWDGTTGTVLDGIDSHRQLELRIKPDNSHYSVLYFYPENLEVIGESLELRVAELERKLAAMYNALRNV